MSYMTFICFGYSEKWKYLRFPSSSMHYVYAKKRKDHWFERWRKPKWVKNYWKLIYI